MIPLVSNDDNSDGTRENLDVLQALQEMLVKISHIEVNKNVFGHGMTRLMYTNPFYYWILIVTYTYALSYTWTKQ